MKLPGSLCRHSRRIHAHPKRYSAAGRPRARSTASPSTIGPTLPERPYAGFPHELSTDPDLRDSGVFLIDLKTDPKRPGEALDDHADDLVARAKAVAPEHVIAIKANVWDHCQGPLRAAGLNVANERVPFPGSGQQTEFLKAMRRALQSIGWHR